MRAPGPTSRPIRITAPYVGRLRAAGCAVLVLLAAGCLRDDPPILTSKQAARVREIELQTPPVNPIPPPTRTAAVDQGLEPSQPPVPLPDAKVARGDDRVEVSLADVREAALNRNLDIEVERFGPALAAEDTRVAEARFEPVGFARYRHSKRNIPEVPAARLADRTRIDDAEVGVSVPLQTGGDASISLPLTRTDLRLPGFEDTYDTAASFSLSHPLLRGAGLAVNRAPITIARLNERQQDSRTKLAILNILANADRNYWQLYAAARGTEVRLNQYERARTLERQAIRLAEEGAVAKIEVIRARAGVARRIQDIIRAENARRRAERELKRVMNRDELPLDSMTAVITSSDPDPRELELDRALAVETAYANRMELFDLELQMAVDALNVDVQRNAKLPALALDYSFRYLGAAASLHDSLDHIGDTRYTDQAIGLSLEVPLGNAARKAQYRSAVIQRALTSTTVEQQRQLIERQVLDALDQIEQSWQLILAAREETLLAGANYAAEQRQFLAGARTSTELLEAADFLAEAQLNEVNALAAYEIAKIDLNFVTGTLLGSGSVEITPWSGSPVSARDDGTRTGARIARKLEARGISAPPAIATPAPVAAEGPAAPLDAVPVETSATDPAATEERTRSEVSSAEAATVAVGEDDTLWSLAAAHRPTRDVPIAAMVNALMQANPTAFVDGDPNRLRAGARLRVPAAAEITP